MGKKKRMAIIPEERHLRVVKSLTGEEEQPPCTVCHSIDSGSLSGGGLKHPASLPGGSGILPEKERETEVLSKPDRSSELEKIKDASSYDPSKLDDAVLRDDFRIVLAWYANWRKSPETFSYSESFIRQLLRKILEEAKKRGPGVITFHPAKMDSDVKGFFLDVAEEVGIPPAQIEKADKLLPDSNPEEMTVSDLVKAHWQLHLMYRKASSSVVPGFSVEDMVNLHSRVVDELYRRGAKHPAPPDDGMDDASSTFEKHVDSQPDWTQVAKRYQRIVHSGNELGEKITLDQVLPHFETFKLRKPYIYLVGGLANHGWTNGDIDILIKDTSDLPEEFKHAVHFRLGRALPGDLASRLQIHYDDYHGPFTNFVELFDLTFERVNPENVVKEMRAIEEADDEDEDVIEDEREKSYSVTEKDFEPDEE